MTDRQPEALRLADAIDEHRFDFIGPSLAATELRRLYEENTALRQAIEQAEKQEPVAWMLDFIDDGFEVKDFVVTKLEYIGTGYNVRPLYTAPLRKKWVGLTHDEALTTWLSPDACKVPQCDKYHHFYLAIEAKLRERNT